MHSAHKSPGAARSVNEQKGLSMKVYLKVYLKRFICSQISRGGQVSKRQERFLERKCTQPFDSKPAIEHPISPVQMSACFSKDPSGQPDKGQRCIRVKVACALFSQRQRRRPLFCRQGLCSCGDAADLVVHILCRGVCFWKSEVYTKNLAVVR